MSLASAGTLASWQTAQGWLSPCRWLKASACCIASPLTNWNGSPKATKSLGWSRAKRSARPRWNAIRNLIRYGNEPFQGRRAANTAWLNKADAQDAAKSVGQNFAFASNAGWKSADAENGIELKNSKILVRKFWRVPFLCAINPTCLKPLTCDCTASVSRMRWNGLSIPRLCHR